MKHTNTQLNQAQVNKEDEFYTRLIDIEKELKNYKEFFKDKIIYCNCDDYRKSNFVKYFKDNFTSLSIKKLLATNYDKDADELWGESSNACKYEFDGCREIVSSLTGSGSFNSPECIEVLKSCDVVVTNPPFSLFNSYIPLLEEYKKSFVVVGNLNAITYKKLFELIQTNRMWHGYNYVKDFAVPDGSVQSFGNITWYTNLPIKKHYKQLLPSLTKTYSPKEYPSYVNYNAINVDKIKNIPIDYFDEIGVPITFLDKYNPDEFEIIGHTSTFEATWDLGVKGTPQSFIEDYRKDGGKRPLTQHTALLGLYNIDGKAILPYARIIIKRKYKE